MKQLFCLLISYFFVSSSFGQSVVNSTGGSLALTEYSVGEPVAGDIFSSGFSLSQGVIQSVEANTELISTSATNDETCAGSSIEIPFTIQGTFTAGNVFTAQLSNASGDFSNPVTIGTGTAAGSINAFIPGSTAAGAGYRVRVVSSNPAITGTDNGSDISIQAFSSLLVNYAATGFLNNAVDAVSVSPTGTAYLGGTFNTNNYRRIASIDAGTGVVNSAFVTTSGFNNQVQAVRYHPNGNIYVLGNFTSYNGVSVNRIACLLPDGTLDLTFKNNIGTGADNHILVMEIDADGSIVIGGSFNNFNGSAARLVRLHPDGSLHTNQFTSLTGISGTNFIKGMIRVGSRYLLGGRLSGKVKFIESNGANVSGFNVNGSYIGQNNFTFLPLADGSVIIGGDFTQFNGTSANNIVKISGTTGAVLSDMGLPSINGQIKAIVQLADGRIMIGGDFTNYNGTSVGRIAFIDENGVLHPSTSNLQSGFNNTVNAIHVLDNGKILVGGAFSHYNGVNRSRIALLEPNPVCYGGGARKGYAENFIEESIAVQLNAPLIYPNPTSHNVQVKYAAVAGISIMNIQGQTVLTAPEQDLTDGVELPLSQLPAGIYFVKISSQHGSNNVYKLIKE